jgi:hypothetical protein
LDLGHWITIRRPGMLACTGRRRRETRWPAARDAARLTGELVFGLRGTVRRAEGIYETRAGRQSDLGRWFGRRRDGVAGRRGGADHELQRGH